MKRMILLALLLTSLLLCGCAAREGAVEAPRAGREEIGATFEPEPAFEIDLTKMSGTMVYAYVFNMVVAPEEYVGQRFRLGGIASESHWPQTDATHRFIIVEDATACCAQGIEYVLSDARADYPAPGAAIEIAGVLAFYEEAGETYFHIVADELRVK